MIVVRWGMAFRFADPFRAARRFAKNNGQAAQKRGCSPEELPHKNALRYL
ncbi:MAG TPA: hypothetical protein VGR73_03635 [Bryobacteraceae bacterium]|nr:hypothetical protein [Bryobacteraceae bacterium]